MLVNRKGDNLTKLEKSQMETINKLQDKIKLYQFDKSSDNAVIRDLKKTIESKKRSIKEVINEIDKIIIEQDYSKLVNIKKWLQIIERQGETNEGFEDSNN